MEVIWNNHAFESLNKNIDHLKKRWSYKNIEKFLNIVDEKIEILKTNPEIGTICEFKPVLRQLVITKHITLFYEIDLDKIYLHLFWLNYNNPDDLQVFFS